MRNTKKKGFFSNHKIQFFFMEKNKIKTKWNEVYQEYKDLNMNKI